VCEWWDFLLSSTELHEVGNYPEAILGRLRKVIAVKLDTSVVDGIHTARLSKCGLLDPEHLPGFLKSGRCPEWAPSDMLYNLIQSGWVSSQGNMDGANCT
jgi:hypothetical protein